MTTRPGCGQIYFQMRRFLSALGRCMRWSFWIRPLDKPPGPSRATRSQTCFCDLLRPSSSSRKFAAAGVTPNMLLTALAATVTKNEKRHLRTRSTQPSGNALGFVNSTAQSTSHLRFRGPASVQSWAQENMSVSMGDIRSRPGISPSAVTARLLISGKASRGNPSKGA